MEEIFSDKFGVEVIEALNLLKENKIHEKEAIKKDITIKRKQMGMYKAEAELYEAMSYKFPDELKYSEGYKKSNQLWSSTELDEKLKKRLNILRIEIEEIDKIIARCEKDNLKNK